MSVELTRAWPQSVQARSIQRTVMVLRQEGLRLGPVTLNWEGGLRCDIAPLGQRFPTGDASGDPLTQITLTTPEPVGRGFFSFIFSMNH